MMSEIFDYLLDGNTRFGTKKNDICIHRFGCDRSLIRENVIIAPWWEPDCYKNVEAEQITDGSVKVWNVKICDKEYTYIKTGIGASVCTDVILSLGCTECKKIIFIGSVGALDENIEIGDIVIPKSSISGDGVCRYLSKDYSRDCFGERYYPDEQFLNSAIKNIETICLKNNVKWHIVDNFSVDTIFAQFAHIDEIINMGCKSIEMETAAAFKAANICGISMCAIFSTSDNTIKKKSLYRGRTEKEMNYRSSVRSLVIPEIIYALL